MIAFSLTKVTLTKKGVILFNMFKRGLTGGITFLFLFSGTAFALEKDYEIALTKGTCKYDRR